MKKSLAFVFSVLVVFSCTNVLDINVDFEKPKIVVNAIFNSDSTWNVSLTRSRSILDNSKTFFEPVSDAEVTIRDENDLIIETLTYTQDKSFEYFYVGNTKPTPGESYFVHIDVSNEKSLSASSNIPVPVEIESVEIDSAAFKSFGEDIEMRLYFNDPSSEKNYFAIKIIRNAYKTMNDDTLRFVEDIFFEPIDPVFQNDFSTGLGTLINDNLFNGSFYEFRLKIRPRPESGSTENYALLLLTVSEEYYNYFTTKNLQDNTSEDPFAQPTQVFSNIENGLGIFAGYSSSVVILR